MNAFRLRQLQSIDELKRCSAAWDDLWLRSETATPGARADMVVLWDQDFGPASIFRALVVEQNDRMVAALPLVDRRLKKLVTVGSLPCNCWATGGALLLDPTVDVPAVLDCLVSALPNLPWPLVWLDQVPFEQPHWREFRGAAERAGLSVSTREHYQVGMVEVGNDWESFKAKMKGDHRRKLGRHVRKLGELGDVEFRVHKEIAPDDVRPLLALGFEVEDRSWKGAEGTSVLKNPDIFEHYCREAQLLAQWRLLELGFLELNGMPIAFDYGWFAKGVHFTMKIGYDEAYAKCAPGQQMVMRLLERMHSSHEHRLLDFAGPLVDFHRMWTATHYPVGPLVIATPRLLSRSLFHAYTRWQPRVRRIQRYVSESYQAFRTAASSAGTRLGQSLNPVSQTPESVGGRTEHEA